ncbi:type II toxin-antitoxin system RelE/ParE family toxin [Candidatus Pacearchaeota archaeon]|nr:type II toxin-antitoxin system RelE/ParE family toxin [Candidatus Pacearchaeota archaeon]
MYNVELSERAQEFLNKLDGHLKERIENSLRRLKENPIPSGVKFIGRDKGEKIFRYRIGDYRALYKIKDKERIVLVAKIDKRPKVYD